MVCAGIDSTINAGISGIMAYPNSCDYFFWLKILVGIFVILSFILYNRDRDKLQKPDMVSSMGVSALATIFLTLVLSLLPGVIQTDVFIEILVGGMVFVVIWLLKK